MEEALPLPVDEQETALRVLDGNDRRGVVEDLLQTRFAVRQLALDARALGNIVTQPALRFGDFDRHRIEGAAQATELIVPFKRTGGPNTPGPSFFAAPPQPRGGACQKKIKNEPHRQRKGSHPAS